MSTPVRIGNAQAFWGDRGEAAVEMLELEPELDFLTLDYLAEVSMSLLARQRDRDETAGYARDFVEVIRSLAPYWSSGGTCRIIANAGGLNPRGCAEACRLALQQAGCRSMRIGIVTGDDVVDLVRSTGREHDAELFQNLESGAPINQLRERIETANAYLGAEPIAQALDAGAEIVVTGRIADPSTVVAACLHHFGWVQDDLSQLAGATVAGHLIECGTQVTGGISTDWLNIPDPAQIGFPIVEVEQDGSCIVTKPTGTGGCVTPMTVKEQLVYEIGDPAAYLSPDVVVSFLSLEVEELSVDRVQVRGASGKQPPGTYKVSATIRDGYCAAGSLTIVGRHAEEKARRCGQLVLQRVRDAGFELRNSVIECVGAGDLSTRLIDVSSHTRSPSNSIGETVLRIAVESETKDAAECFSRQLMPFITAGPQGITGYAEGRPRVRPTFRFWPCLISRDSVTPQVETIITSPSGDTTRPTRSSVTPGRKRQSLEAKDDPARQRPVVNGPPSTLYDIAHARSGDKGTSANIGIIARGTESWPLLQRWLTADRVERFFAALNLESVERFELSNLHALNFVLHGAVKCPLRTDVQGKTFGQLLLEMELPEDDCV